MSRQQRETHHFVNENVDLKQLVVMAQKSLASNGDNEYYVSRSEMMLIYKHKEAKMISSRPEIGGNYVIKVRFMGIKFIHITSSPFIFPRDVFEHYLNLGSSSIH